MTIEIKTPPLTPSQKKAQKEWLERQKARMKLATLLLQNIKSNFSKLEAALMGLDDSLMVGVKKSKQEMGLSEDNIYRFYHGSFKVYQLQEITQNIVLLLSELDPKDNKKFCSFFEEIILSSMQVGGWKHSHNMKWTKHTRPIVEAFFHAQYFLAMAVKYGNMFKNRKNPPNSLPSGWACLMELYEIR